MCFSHCDLWSPKLRWMERHLSGWFMPFHALLTSRDFLKPARRSTPAAAIFDPLRSVFRFAHMLWLWGRIWILCWPYWDKRIIYLSIRTNIYRVCIWYYIFFCLIVNFRCCCFWKQCYAVVSSIQTDYSVTGRPIREAVVLRRERLIKMQLRRERQQKLYQTVRRRQCHPHCHQFTAARWSPLHHASRRRNVPSPTLSPVSHQRGLLIYAVCASVHFVRFTAFNSTPLINFLSSGSEAATTLEVIFEGFFMIGCCNVRDSQSHCGMLP